MRKYFSTAAFVAALICTSLPVAAATPSEFYASLLRRGIAAYEGGRFDVAARHLRFAAFGYVDSLEAYQTAQVYLALTHDRLGEQDRVREAVRRVLQAERIERRFAGLQLPASVRAAFDKLASTVLSPGELAGLRGTAELPPAAVIPSRVRTTTTGTATTPQTAQTQPPAAQQPPPASTTVTETTTPPVVVDRIDVEVTTAQTPASQPAETQPPAAPSTTTGPATQTQQPVTPQAVAPQTSPQTPPAQNTTVTTPQAQPETPRTTTIPPAQPVITPNTPPRPAEPRAVTYSAAELAVRFAAAERALVTSNLAEARRIYRELLASTNAAAHATAIRVGEGLYRARDFAGALAAFERAGPLQRGEEPYRYYIAVALYETGQYDRAKRELAAVLPYIEVTPDVDRYRSKIQNAIQ